MPHILKNSHLEMHIDHPLEGYHFGRFDWSGKIVAVKFQNIDISTVERTDTENEYHFGKGFYNEFGIDSALGFDDVKIGGWFHKIGVGLLKKDDGPYLFSKKYAIEPAEFEMVADSNKVAIQSKAINGYAYVLKKEIALYESSFTINYKLENTGEKNIVTSEYVHNFVAINNNIIGTHYLLKVPFQLKPDLFVDTVNPERKVVIGPHEVKFNGIPNEQFFFSNLSGNEVVDAKWALINTKDKIGISETGSFQTSKVNLWGWKHVISPELFFHVFVKPGQSIEWSRRYDIFEIY